MPFCPVCGKNIPRGQEFCEDHNPNKLAIKPFSLRVCSCGRVFTHNRWVTIQSLDASVKKLLREHIKQSVTLSELSLPMPQKRGQKTAGRVMVSTASESFPFPFTITLSRCDKCAKTRTNYYTAILQLRQPPAAALPFIEQYLDQRKEKGVSVNKVEETPRGPDLYLTHKSVARQLGEKLVRKFGGTMDQSEQLFSRNRQTSKEVYRLHVLVNFPQFSVGDVVLINGRAVLVTGVGKQCTGRDIERDKKVVFTSGEEEGVCEQHETTVSLVHPRLEVIHPQTYQSVPVANHSKKLNLGDQVTVVANPSQGVLLV